MESGAAEAAKTSRDSHRGGSAAEGVRGAGRQGHRPDIATQQASRGEASAQPPLSWLRLRELNRDRKTPTVADSGGVDMKHFLLEAVYVLVLSSMISVVCAPRPAPVYINITPVPRQGRDVFVPSVSGGDVAKLFI